MYPNPHITAGTIINATYNEEFDWNWNLHFRLESLIDMNFDGIQDDDTDYGHDESWNVGFSDMFEDQNICLK